MTDEEILTAHGFTQTQAADAIAKDPKDRTWAERDLIKDLVQEWMK
jgi:hypothetical protein